ncbi:MAG: response regulator [Lachnospiraceae bacterium]|nr:response regulator [Lachnospiraceae bacterium]
MNSLINKYLNENIPIKHRLFFIATFTGSLGALLYTLFGILVRINPLVVLVFLFVAVLGYVLFLTGANKPGSIGICSHIFLISCNIICFPLLMLINDNTTVEMAIYFFIGITYGAVLFAGRARIIYLFILFLVDGVVSFLNFYVRIENGGYIGANTAVDYIRIEIAIIMTATLCGVIIGYRNRVLSKEMQKKEEAILKAEQVNFAKDMFLVNVSHEIRTPLNAIIGTADMVIESEAVNHVKEMAYNISNSSHALLSITSDLLDFSRMNTENFTPVNEKYDISGMLNDIINLISVRLLDSNIEFFVDIAAGIPKFLIGDSGKIRQIMINMLSNAVKYTREGHVKLSVCFEYETGNMIRLKISVEDTGIGIREENLEKIFEPYNRSGEATDRMIEGNGLGLALCRKLSEAMGGRIGATSVYGKGSVFSFEVDQTLETPYTGGTVGGIREDIVSIGYYLAKEQESAELGKILDDMEVRKHAASSLNEFLDICRNEKHDYYLIDSVSYDKNKSEVNDTGVDWKKVAIISPCNYSYSGEPFEYVLSKPVSCLNLSDLVNKTQNYAIRKHMYEGKFSLPDVNILVVDDNLVNLEVTANILSRYGANIITAASGREGITVMENERVDLIFLDYMMPDLDGIDTLKEIKKLEGGRYSGIPAVALTANVVSGAKEFFLEAGFDDYLSKPIEIEKMEKIIIKLLPSESVRLAV